MLCVLQYKEIKRNTLEKKSIRVKNMSKQQQTITKQLQNLYSWTQFYKERGNKDQIRKCQTQIAALKKAYNETKTKK